MFGVRGGGDILTSSVLKFSAAGRASMPEECLRARAALWQGCSACPAVLTAARDALELCPTKSTVGFAVPPRPRPRRHQLSVETVVPGTKPMSSPETGATGKRASVDSAAELADAKRSKPEDVVTFVIPSGDHFVLPLAALRLNVFKNSLLARLVDSAVPTGTDANGAISIGFEECSADAFQRVADEVEFALYVDARTAGNGNYDLKDFLQAAGPPLRTAVSPRAMFALSDYLGLPAFMRSDSRRAHPDTPIPVRVAEVALKRGYDLAIRLEQFARAVSSTVSVIDWVNLASGSTGRSTIDVAIFMNMTDAGEFPVEFPRLLQNPEQIEELRRVHGLPDLAAGLAARKCTADELKLIENEQLRVVRPFFSRTVPMWQV